MDGKIDNCYATGKISSTTDSKDNAHLSPQGLVGNNNDGKITDCFWNITTSEITAAEYATGLTSAEMLQQEKFVSAGWDFTDTWSINPGATYPWLKGLDYAVPGYPAPQEKH